MEKERRMSKYRATISENTGGSLSMIFRHPRKPDEKTGYGKRIRRGLGTRDEKVAQKYIDEMNEILSNYIFWNNEKKEYAKSKFSEIVVNAYYDNLETEIMDNRKKLDEKMPIYEIPKELDRVESDEAQDYAEDHGKESINKVPKKESDILHFLSSQKTPLCKEFLVMGEQWSGKMDFIHEISGLQTKGINPNMEKTFCFGDHFNFQIGVSFVSERDFEFAIKEILRSIAIDFLMDSTLDSGYRPFNDEDRIDLLLHESVAGIQLSYILGEQPEKSLTASYLNSIYHIVLDYKEDYTRKNIILMDRFRIQGEFGEGEVDQNYFSYRFDDDMEHDFEKFLFTNDLFYELIEQIKTVVRKAYKEFDSTNLTYSDWLHDWFFETKNQEEFISVYHKLFNAKEHRILRSMISEIRVKSNMIDENYRTCLLPFKKGIMLTDASQYFKDNSEFLSFSLFEKIHSCHAILFFVSAVKGLSEKDKKAIKSLIESGFAENMLFVYTHMDLLGDEMFESEEDKRNSVFRELRGYLESLRKGWVKVLSDYLFEKLTTRVFFLDKLDAIKKQSNQNEIENIFNRLEKKFTNDKKLYEDLKKTYAKIKLIGYRETHSYGKEFQIQTLAFQVLRLYPYLQEASRDFWRIWKRKLNEKYNQNMPSNSNNSEFTQWHLKYLFRESNYSRLFDFSIREISPITDFFSILTSYLSFFLTNEKKPQISLLHIGAPKDFKLCDGEQIVEAFKRILNRKLLLYIDRNHVFFNYRPKIIKAFRQYEEPPTLSDMKNQYYTDLRDCFPELSIFSSLDKVAQERFVDEIEAMVREVVFAFQCTYLYKDFDNKRIF